MTDILAGVTKLSTVDYPGELATVLYMPGCNMHCPYCHNRDIVLDSTVGVPWDSVKNWICSRSNLTAVVISGGEPMTPRNVEFTRKIVEWAYRSGMKVKLDTNNTMYRSTLVSWHGWLSYLALDFKGLPEHYADFGYQGPVDLEFDWLRTYYPEKCELRTTVHKKLLTFEHLRKMKALVPAGVPWYWQKFRPCACFDMSLNDAANYTDEEMGRMAKELDAVTRGCGMQDEITAKCHDMTVHPERYTPPTAEVTLSGDAAPPHDLNVQQCKTTTGTEAQQ